MHIDAENVFSDSQAITASAASANVLDLEGANSTLMQELMRKIGEAKLVALVTEGFNNLTSLDITLQSCDLEDFSSGVQQLFSVGINLANLSLGKQLAIGGALNNSKRYVRMYYTVNGDAPTTGKLFCGIVMDMQTNGMAA